MQEIESKSYKAVVGSFIFLGVSRMIHHLFFPLCSTMFSSLASRNVIILTEFDFFPGKSHAGSTSETISASGTVPTCDPSSEVRG